MKPMYSPKSKEIFLATINRMKIGVFKGIKKNEIRSFSNKNPQYYINNNNNNRYKEHISY